LAHPPRQLSRQEAASGGQLEQLQQLGHATVEADPDPVGETDQLQVLAHGQVGIQQRAVGHE
jgi:hypothetical protein